MDLSFATRGCESVGEFFLSIIKPQFFWIRQCTGNIQDSYYDITVNNFSLIFEWPAVLTIAVFHNIPNMKAQIGIFFLNVWEMVCKFFSTNYLPCLSRCKVFCFSCVRFILTRLLTKYLKKSSFTCCDQGRVPERFRYNNIRFEIYVWLSLLCQLSCAILRLPSR